MNKSVLVLLTMPPLFPGFKRKVAFIFIQLTMGPYNWKPPKSFGQVGKSFNTTSSFPSDFHHMNIYISLRDKIIIQKSFKKKYELAKDII